MLEMIDIGIENATAIRVAGKVTEEEMTAVLSDAKAKTEAYGNIVIYEEIESFAGIELAAIIEGGCAGPVPRPLCFSSLH